MKQTFSLKRLACHLCLHVADNWIEEICAPWRSWWSCARASIFSFQFFTQAKPHLPRDSGGRERALKHVTFSLPLETQSAKRGGLQKTTLVTAIGREGILSTVSKYARIYHEIEHGILGNSFQFVPGVASVCSPFCGRLQ